MNDIVKDPSERASRSAANTAAAEKDKLRVFISYSRDDLAFADQLDAALDICGFECVLDRHGIHGGEDWKRRLGALIADADTVVFVLSPASARSEVCEWEVEESARLNKRILPIICRSLEGVEPPMRLQSLNYIFFHAEGTPPGSGFGSGLAKLVAALNTEFDWLREHTRYAQRASEWNTGARPANRLLSGDDIRVAKEWLARRPKSAPEPTALQLDFIRASEEETDARLNAERKRLDEMAMAQAERERAVAAKEEALEKAAREQQRAAEIDRSRSRIRNRALIVVSFLAVVAGAFWLRAEGRRREADQILGGATNIIASTQQYMDSRTKQDATALFQMGAKHGNPRSMSNLGLSYSDGRGVEQDYSKAREWWEKAADMGDSISMVGLGSLYDNGYGVAQDYAKAREWWEKAVDKGDGSAMSNLGSLYANGHGVPQDHVKAREWWEKAADKGDARAMSNLGRVYANGHGVAQDYAKAREWWEKAVDKGDGSAMSNLGVLYDNGHGVTQDYAKAREWWEKAADKGDARAMASLGLLYANGHGVPQDYVKAREWSEKAADKGDAEAKANLENLQIVESQRARRYIEALRLAEALAVKMEAAETRREGKSGKETAWALGKVSAYALLGREFKKALALANQAHSLLPDDLAIETNRAHALMFTGKKAEARALYLRYKGKPIVLAGNKPWETVIADDFAEFRKAGLTPPMMAEIEKALGVSR